MTKRRPAAGRWARPRSRRCSAAAASAAYALDDRPLAPDVRALQGYGSQIADPLHGSRQRPDGEIVEWWTAAPPRIGPDDLPILIEHSMTGAEWGAEAMAERAHRRHPIGSPVSLVGLELAVVDPTAVAAEHARQLGMAFSLIGATAVCTLGAHVIRLMPRSRADAPAVVTLAADAAPRSAELLGVRIEIEQAELPLVS